MKSAMLDKNKLLARKQLELVCRRYPFLFWSSLLASGGLSATLWQVVERQSLLLVLFAVLWSVMAVHFVYSRRYLDLVEVAEPDKWRNALVAGTAVVGACWGIAVFAVASSPLEMSVILLMFVLAGVAAFASVTLAAAPFAAEAFLLPAILPGTLWMLFYGEQLVFFMGVISLAYLGLMLLFSRRTYQMIRSLLLTAENNVRLLAAQRESDRRNAELFANFEDCIVFTDVDHDGNLTVASINPAMERLCGTSEAEVRGKCKLDLFPAALGERLEAYDRKCIASGMPLHCEEMVEHSSGKRYFSISKIPLRDETGRVSRIAVIARDITLRKQTEEALAKREREFRTLVENAPDPIIRYDRACRRVYVNKAVEWLGGISASDMIGKTPAEAAWVGSDEKAKMLQSIRRVLETGRQEEITVQIAALDGSTLHLHHLHVPEFAADGSVESVLSIGRDITSRKYMEEVLRKSEREYRVLSENSPDSIVRYDDDCRIRYLNKHFNAELGMPAGFLMGKTLSEIFTDGTFDEHEQILQQVLESGREAEHFITLQNRGDGERYLHFRFVPEQDKHGEMCGVLAIGRDLTGHKLMELSLAAREREFRSLAENMPENMVRFDTLGRYLYVNPTHERLLGVSFGEIVGTCIPDSHGQVKAGIAQVVASGQPMQIEQRVPVGGSIEIHSVSLAPEFDADGIIVSVLAIGRDMTGIYRMQEALSSREQEFRMLAENLPVAVIRYDAECRRRYLNPAAERALHGNADELLGHVPGGSTVPATPAMIAHYRERMEEVLAGGVARELEFVLDALPAGQQEFYEVRFAPEYCAEGKVCGVLALWYDISVRKRLENEAKQRETEFRALAENLPDPVFRYDRDCRRVYVNPAAARVTATPAGQLLGNQPTDTATVKPESAAKTMALIREVFATGERRELFVEYLTGNGKTSEYQGLLVPEFDANGQVATVLALAHEVTDLREAERRTASFFANMPGFAFTFRVSPDGRMSFPFASRGIEELYGLRPEDVRENGAVLHALAHPDDQPRIETAMAESAKTLQAFQVEVRVQRLGQPERWVECRSMPERQADGELLWYGVMLDITGRKRMEAELLRTTGFQKLLLDSLREVGMWQLVVESGKIIYHNDSHIGDLLGYAASDFDAAPYFIDVVHPDDRPRIAEIYRRRLAGEAVPNSYEIGLLAKDGSRREYQLYASLIPGSNPPRTMTLAVDITERKQMELALQEGEARYRHNYHLLQSVLESASDVGVFALDRDYRYISFNAKHRDNTKRLRGADVALGKCMLDTINCEEFRGFFRQGFDHVLAGNNLSVESREEFIQNGNLTYEYYENHGSPIRNDDGNIVGLTVFTHDITARKHAEDELRSRFERIVELNERLEDNARTMEEHAVELEASQEQLKDTLEFTRGVINAIPDILFEVDRDGRYLNVWTQKPELLAVQKDVLLGKTIPEMLAAESAATAMDALRAAEETGLSFGKVIRIDLPQGESWFELSVSRKPGGAPSDIRFLVLSRDITGRKQMEIAREAALAEARHLAHLRSVFMAQMSHELRTPLNGILGYTQNLLQAEALGEKQTAGLQIIQNSGEHLLSLINGILDHAAIEADKFELIPDDIELDAFLSSIVGMIRVRAEQKNLAFICEAAADLPAVVRGDAQRLRQVLLNLLANAVKFTDRGQVTLRVNYTAAARMHFAVQDSGIGIASDQLETIFLPFEQVGESNRRAGGNGLGLAISRKLVRLMGGDIKVQSQLGAGSTFSFEIDMATGQSGTAKVNAAALSGLAVTRVARATPLLMVPSSQELDILYGHAMRGSMRDVIKHADQLVDSDGRYQPFAEQLRLLAGSFQTKALVALIAEYRDGNA
jgi:PAS domain S-box-containing protein